MDVLIFDVYTVPKHVNDPESGTQVEYEKLATKNRSGWAQIAIQIICIKPLKQGKKGLT